MLYIITNISRKLLSQFFETLFRQSVVPCASTDVNITPLSSDDVFLQSYLFLCVFLCVRCGVEFNIFSMKRRAVFNHVIAYAWKRGLGIVPKQSYLD